MTIVDPLDARRSLDVTGGHVALALGGQVKGLRAVDLDAQHHTLEVEDDVNDVLDDSGDRGELVLHTLDAHGSDRRPGNPGEQRAPQGVAERVSKPGLQRLHEEPRAVLVDYLFFDVRALNDQHWQTPYFEYSSTINCS